MALDPIPVIPENELTIDFSRSSGPGGQNVNKVNTKAWARFKISDSLVLSAEQKNRLRHKLASRITGDDELVVYAESERSQLQNRAKATEALQDLIKQALIIPKKRVPTKPTRGSKERRLEQKKSRSKIKTRRAKKFDWKFV